MNYLYILEHYRNHFLFKYLDYINEISHQFKTHKTDDFCFSFIRLNVTVILGANSV